MQKFDLKPSRENLAAIKEDMRKEIEACIPLQRELALLKVDELTISNSLGVLSDYVHTLKEVEACRQAGRCLHDNQYHNYTLQYHHPFISLVPTVCPVFFEKQTLMAKFAYKDFPLEMLEMNAENLPTRRSFAPFVRELIAMYRGSVKTIFAYGDHGIGKLETALPFLKKIVQEQKDVTVGVFHYPTFIRQYAGDYYANKATIDQYIDSLTAVDYLIINDFGNEETNKLVREAITFPLITGRIHQKKATIFLSEMSLSSISRLYDFSGKDVRSQQIISTITHAITEEIFLTGTKI
ncbi:MAG: hypothetical protein WC968_01815 [Bacilli bacterium]